MPSTKDRKTNIIIKGATFTSKPANKTPKSKQPTSGKKANASKKEKVSNDLMEKLLTEITAKYKTNLCRDQNYLQRLEKKTMIQEIQMLAQALISCDRAQKKHNQNNEKVI